MTRWRGCWSLRLLRRWICCRRRWRALRSGWIITRRLLRMSCYCSMIWGGMLSRIITDSRTRFRSCIMEIIWDLFRLFKKLQWIISIAKGVRILIKVNSRKFWNFLKYDLLFSFFSLLRLVFTVSKLRFLNGSFLHDFARVLLMYLNANEAEMEIVLNFLYSFSMNLKFLSLICLIAFTLALRDPVSHLLSSPHWSITLIWPLPSNKLWEPMAISISRSTPLTSQEPTKRKLLRRQYSLLLIIMERPNLLNRLFIRSNTTRIAPWASLTISCIKRSVWVPQLDTILSGWGKEVDVGLFIS